MLSEGLSIFFFFSSSTLTFDDKENNLQEGRSDLEFSEESYTQPCLMLLTKPSQREMAA